MTISVNSLPTWVEATFSSCIPTVVAAFAAANAEAALAEYEFIATTDPALHPLDLRHCVSILWGYVSEASTASLDDAIAMATILAPDTTQPNCCVSPSDVLATTACVAHALRFCTTGNLSEVVWCCEMAVGVSFSAAEWHLIDRDQRTPSYDEIVRHPLLSNELAFQTEASSIVKSRGMPTSALYGTLRELAMAHVAQRRAWR